MTAEPIGFIGLGDMGGAIAQRLATSGFDLLAHDRRTELRSEVLGWGARWADDGSAVASECNVVAICLVNDEQILAATLGEQGLLARMNPGSCLLVFSTLIPRTMKLLESKANDLGIFLVDAPVSGGRAAAERGELTVMLGGKTENLERVRRVVDAVGKCVFHVGNEVGDGQAAKLCNNLMALNNNLVLLEGLRLGRALGLSERALLDVVAVSSGNSWYVDNWGFTDGLLLHHPMAGEEANYYLLIKDLFCALEAAHDVNQPLVLTGLTAQYGPELLRDRLVQLRQNMSDEANTADTLTPPRQENH